MSTSAYWTNPFHFNSFIGKIDKSGEVFDPEEKNQNMSMTMNNVLFNLSDEMQEMQLPTNIKENEMNISEHINLNIFGKKDQGFDKSIYTIDQNFNENSHMILEEEFEKENKDKIEKDTGFDHIIEKEFEDESNVSFLHENNYFIDHCCDESSIAIDENNINNNIINNNNNNNMMNTTALNDTKLEGLCDENELLKITKNFISLKFAKNNNSISYTNSITKENTFNNNANKSVLNDHKKVFNVIKQGDDLLSSHMNLNASSCLLSYKPKKGRTKKLLDGIKTEVIDKAFLREFKRYLKTKQKEYSKFFEEDPIFWKEFFANSQPPFNFTWEGEKLEFKSYNKNLLNYIFSKHSTNKLYSLFISDKKEFAYRQMFSRKRVKKIDYKTYKFLVFYRKNLHQFYSPDSSASEINLDELDFNNIPSDLMNSSFQFNNI